MRVTFIFCAVGIAGFNANRQPCDREGSWVGHGVASVAAATRKAGHEVDLIDLRQLSGWDAFIQRIEQYPADVYGLSVAPVDYYSALKAVFEIRTHVPAAKIIVGGIHPSIFPEQYTEFNVIDCVVTGEGEITFPELLNDINNLPKRIAGKKPDLDAIPWVARDLFDYPRELSCNFAPDQALPSITMLAGRGCAFKCAYCQPAENAVFGKPFRMRSVENVIDEMTYLYSKYSYKSVTFWDDTFTFLPAWVDEFCEQYKNSGINASIAACSRADIICRNEGMIEKMADAGVDWLVIGLESGSQRLLDLIKKGTTVEQNYEAVKICHKYGIKVFATYMYGLPTETPEESYQTAMMIQDTAPEFPSPFWFMPIQGTDIYNFCKERDLILHEDETIERTGVFVPRIKDVDYEFIKKLMLKGAK
jgi:anaerobic magnesium-protoporphyrin IX monomethyl ester cyclase